MPSTADEGAALAPTQTPTPAPQRLVIDLVPTTALSPNRTIPKESTSPFGPSTQLSIPPGPHGGRGLNDILFATKLPDGWTEYVHPDGKPYFFHGEWGVVTEKDVRRNTDRRQVEMVRSAIMGKWAELKAEKPEVAEVVGDSFGIFIMITDAYYYYLVSHRTQEIFWLVDVDLGKTRLGPADDNGGVSYDIILRQHYYAHLDSFPCHREVPIDGIHFLHGYLTYIAADDLTTDFKATPWDPQHAKLLLDMLDSSLSKGPEKAPNGFRTFYIARLLMVVYQSRAIHRHGTDRAINCRPSIPPQRVTVLHLVSSAFCFFAHATYEDRLREVFEVEVVSRTQWKRLIASLVREWSDSNLLATITLLANMAFLAVDNLSQVAITSSIASAFFAIGSITVGLHHVWKHRDRKDMGIKEVTNYARNTSANHGHIWRLAILLSLPIIFLLWALLALTCAIASYAFSPQKAIAAYVTPACALAIVCALGVFTNQVFWNAFAYKARKPTPKPILT